LSHWYLQAQQAQCNECLQRIFLSEQNWKMPGALAVQRLKPALIASLFNSVSLAVLLAM
jgi:hypothetical protein